MRKKILITIVLLAISFSLFYLLFFQQEFRKTIYLKMPITSVTEQFTNPENLKKWFVPFSNAQVNQQVTVDPSNRFISTGEQRLQIQNQSIYSSLLTYSNGKKEKQFILSALPDTGRNAGTSLTLIYKNSYFKKWFGQGEAEKYAIESFTNFKAYTEDSKRMYGFEINPVKVTDTAFLFIRKTVPYTERTAATKTIFDDLIAYAAKRDAGYNGVRIFYSIKSDDEITLFASIGITTQIAISESEPYEYKMMPFEKNLLEATYQGPYREADQVYTALKAYMQDHNLSTMAIPFQKFISDGYAFTDDQIVQMKVYYPVF